MADINPKCLILFFFKYFPPIEYGITIVPKISKTLIGRIKVVCRKAVRIALGVMNSHPNVFHLCRNSYFRFPNYAECYKLLYFYFEVNISKFTLLIKSYKLA